MKRVRINLVTLVLALLGLFIAIWLTIEHYLPGLGPPCMEGPQGCVGALQSSYGHVGPIPTAAFGTAMYLAVIAICAARSRALSKFLSLAAGSQSNEATQLPAPEVTSDVVENAALPTAIVRLSYVVPGLRRLDLALWLLSGAGACVSLFLQYTALFTLRAFCPWCILSALIMCTIFVLASREFLFADVPLTGEQKLLAGVVGFILTLLGIVYGVEIMMVWPTPQLQPGPVSNDRTDVFRTMLVSKDMYIRGSKDAPDILVEFADYQCPQCQTATQTVDAVVKRLPQLVRVAFRNFPLDSHPFARLASMAAEAAGKQGKFWEMHDYLYRHQADMDNPGFGDSSFDTDAKAIGLDVKRFDADRNSKEIQAKVYGDYMTAKQIGVTMTPTFFLVTPRQVRVVGSLAMLQDALDHPNGDIWK